jgi:hypothetical protein
MSFNDYRNNLHIIGENKLISIIDENRLAIDDRYFNYYRTSYDADEIINIVDKSFRALLLNLDLKVKQGVENTKYEITFIESSIESFHYFAVNNFVSSENKDRIVNLIKDYTLLLKEIRVNPYVFTDDVRSISDGNDSISDTPLLEDAATSENSFYNHITQAKRVLNNFFQNTRQMASWCFRRVKCGFNYCVNRFY